MTTTVKQRENFASFSKRKPQNWPWWCTPVILALRRDNGRKIINLGPSWAVQGDPSFLLRVQQKKKK